MHQLTYSDVNGHNSPAFLYRNTTLVLIINQSDKCVITSFPVTISIKRDDFLWICDLYFVTLFCFTQRFQRLHLSSMLSTCPVPHCPVSSGKWEHVAQLLQGCMCADQLVSIYKLKQPAGFESDQGTDLQRSSSERRHQFGSLLLCHQFS